MSITTWLGKKLGFKEGGGAMLRRAWDTLHHVPGGKRIFSGILGRMAPYTGTIDPRVEELRVGYARIRMEDTRAVRNHLRSVHAVALCNLLELTGNLALLYGLDPRARCIVTGLHITYEKKARGPITGISSCHVPDPPDERISHEGAVRLIDEDGDTVATGRVDWLIDSK